VPHRYDLEDLSRTPQGSFAEVPTAVFARVRACNRETGIDAASVQSLLAAARQDVEDAARDLAAAIGRHLGQPMSRRDCRRERRRRLNGRGQVVHE